MPFLVREPDVVVCVYVTAQKKGTLSLHEREWGIRSGPPLSTSSPRQWRDDSRNATRPTPRDGQRPGLCDRANPRRSWEAQAVIAGNDCGPMPGNTRCSYWNLL